MSQTAIIILFFVIGTIVVLLVGFIGNKISDGVSNAVRAKKVQRQQRDPRPRQSESLAARYNRMSPQAARMPQADAPQLQFCTKCGQPLDAGAKWCHACGTKLEP